MPHQRSGIRTRLAQLADLPGWPESAGAVPGDAATGVPDRLAAIVEAAVLRFGTHGHGNPVMLVHAATAPNAIARVLPVLPAALWEPSIQAAWAATAAVTSTYAPRVARALPTGAEDAGAVLHRATASGDAHHQVRRRRDRPVGARPGPAVARGIPAGPRPDRLAPPGTRAPETIPAKREERIGFDKCTPNAESHRFRVAVDKILGALEWSCFHCGIRTMRCHDKSPAD